MMNFVACLDQIKHDTFVSSLFHFNIHISYNGESLLLICSKTSSGRRRERLAPRHGSIRHWVVGGSVLSPAVGQDVLGP